MKTLTTLLAFIAALSVHAQDYFWVGNSGDWSDLSHWATTSGGATFHNTLPGPDNDVYFDANSFTEANATVTIDLDDVSCRNFDASAATNNPSINGVSFCDQLHVHGDLIIPETVGRQLKCVFLSGTGDHIVSLGGVNMGNSSFLRHAAGNYTLQDSLSATNLYIEASTGTFDTQGLPIYAPARIRSYAGNNATFDAAGSRIYTNEFSMHESNTLIFDNTEIYISGQSNWDFSGGSGMFYPYVAFDGVHTISEDASFGEVIIQPGSDITILQGNTVTAEQFTLEGTSDNPTSIHTEAVGAEAFFSQASGAVDGIWLILQDIHATGGAEFNTLLTVDNGNNDGWNISEPVPQDYYWVGGTGDWSDPSHWATSSGGSDFHPFPPTLLDDVIFDANSFDSADDMVIIESDQQIGSMDATGALAEATVMTTSSYSLTINTDFTAGDLIWQIAGGVEMNATTSGTISQGNADMTSSYVRITGTGVIEVADSLSLISFQINNGSVVTNGNPIHCSGGFTASGAGVNAIDITGSSIYMSNLNFNANNADFISDGSTLFVDGTFLSGDQTYNDVVFREDGFIADNNPTFNTITIEPQASLALAAGIEVTLNDLIAEGTPDDLIEINCISPGETGTFIKDSGEINVSYVELQDNIATGGATFNAANSIDGGNVSGWNIESLVPLDYYWIGGSGDWSDETNWATSSGGTELHNAVPSAIDNVFFDANSFGAATDEVSIDITAEAGTIDATGALSGVTVSSLDDEALTLTGSLTGGDLNWSVNVLRFDNPGIASVTTNTGNFSGTTLRCDGSGTVNLFDSLSVANLIVDNGTFIANGNPLHVTQSFTIDDSFSPTVNLTASNLYVNTWEANNAMATYTLDGTTFFVQDAFFGGDGIAYGAVTVEGDVAMDGTPVIDNLTIDPQGALGITIGSVISINALVANGTEDDLIEIYCTTPGGTGTFFKESGQVYAQYVDLVDNHATGGATFTAFESNEGANVEGWNFEFEIFVDESSASTVNVYPNPTFGLLYLSSPEQVQSIRLVDATGKVVLDHTVPTTGLDCSALPSGVYFAQITLRSGGVEFVRVVKE